MAKKLETIKLIASLEKAGRTTKKAIWTDLAERLSAPSRNNTAISVAKLNTLAKKNAGKTLIVLSKILSDGEFSEKATIVAVSVSEKARAKLASGKVISLKEYVKDAAKADLKKVVIVK
jgi:large subunit ribosomal protein L18e